MTLDAFSSDYGAARSRFRQAAARLGWTQGAHPIGARGPDGKELTIDVASSAGDPECVLVVSSGIHGVEGFFGSAVQLTLLERWATSSPPSVKCVFLHGLNPYGFSWRRRVDEKNVDPNRNFLLPGDRFEGASDHYARLDPFLNLRRAPGRWDMFVLQALPLIARYGIAALRQAIAEGQYAFPHGLFYGGAEPSQMQRILSAHLPQWLAGSRHVIHLDFHTGLGPSGAHKLLIDYPLNSGQQTRLLDLFGADSFATVESRRQAYEARGGFGRWCVSQELAADYLFAYAEFGTYNALSMMAGLRAENQAHHWGDPAAESTHRAKERLRELFCPADPHWRSRVLTTAVDLVGRARRGLEGLRSAAS